MKLKFVIFTFHPGDHGTQQDQSLCLDYGIERKQSPSWKDMLELSSSSAGVDSHVKTSNCSTRAFGLASPARNMFDHVRVFIFCYIFLYRISGFSLVSALAVRNT